MYYLLNPETQEVRCVTSLGDEQKLKVEGWISISGDHFTMIDNIAQIGKLTTQRDALLEALDSKVVAAYSEEIEKLQKISGEICSLQSSSVIAKQRDKLLEALEDLVSEADFKKAVAGEYGHFEEATLKAKKLIKELK